ncbi:MAG: hypothetical protein ACQESP_09550, partial [Candidatus Muiribacteriota bacterium]
FIFLSSSIIFSGSGISILLRIWLNSSKKYFSLSKAVRYNVFLKSIRVFMSWNIAFISALNL